MDRKEVKKLESIFRKISSKELVGAEFRDSPLIYSVIGFLPACEGTDQAMLIGNLGYLLAQQGFNTCIVDFKVFNPNLYYLFGVDPPARGKGLIRVLKSDKADMREDIDPTSEENLYLLSPVPMICWRNTSNLVSRILNRYYPHLRECSILSCWTFHIILHSNSVRGR